MIDSQILYLTLAALAFGLALNLKLTLSVLQTTRREREPPQMLMAGQHIPGVTARTTSGRIELISEGQATVLLFLASKCPKCRAKLPEVERMLAGAQQAGLAMWLVSEESGWRLRGFLRGSSLWGNTARVTLKDYKVLNASLTSPAYLFVNHEGLIEATGLIGDPDWLALRAQLGDEQAGLELAA